jgi:hypothetical protein
VALLDRREADCDVFSSRDGLLQRDNLGEVVAFRRDADQFLDALILRLAFAKHVVEVVRDVNLTA